MRVFPTHVGMDREAHQAGLDVGGIPHARGDGPRRSRARCNRLRYSPRTWGWTGMLLPLRLPRRVFPTHVGMDPPTPPRASSSLRIPHARGDGPILGEGQGFNAMYSPRTWGWTGFGADTLGGTGVFPTHVGMDRWHSRACAGSSRIPHARGDGP